MEKRNLVDQRPEQVQRFFADYAAQLASQGSVVAGYRQRGELRLGPYYKLVCRDACGKQVAVYLGTEGPLVADARLRLAALQAPTQQQRQWQGVRRLARRELRAARQVLRSELAKVGLKQKGAEIRGWRQISNAS